MPAKRQLKQRSIYDKQYVLELFAANDISEKHYIRILRYIIQNPHASWSDTPNVPKAAIALLDQNCVACSCKIIQSKISDNRDTQKLLIQLQDGMQIESVIMKYDKDASLGQNGTMRCTLCVSSQVGCQMGCTFCATGTMQLKGDLTSGEIVEQLLLARQFAPIRNVVFMGMGEPLNNYQSVVDAVQIMTDGTCFALSQRHVTVSTVGIIPRIVQLADDLPGVSLALSLHAPNQELRLSMVPSARAYPLRKLLAAIDTYQSKTGQRVFVEYVLLRGINDQVQHARELCNLLTQKNVMLNIIPWNPILAPNGITYDAPDSGDVKEFQRIMREEGGINCSIRQEKGGDISGACGQLVVENATQYMTANTETNQQPSIKDIEDMN